MEMTRKKITISALVVFMIICFAVYGPNHIKASEFEGNEAYWTNYCSGYISDVNKRNKCNEYTAYLSNKINDSKNQADSMNDDISSVKAELSSIKAKSQEILDEIRTLETEVSAIEAALSEAREGIEQAQTAIDEKEEKIDKRKDIIKERMVAMQSRVNTNQFIDYIMGASDLVDLIQRSSSVESFTKNDKEQIALLNEEKVQLEEEKAEKKRIEDNLKVQQDNLNVTKQSLEIKKANSDALVEKFEDQVAVMLKAQNEANAAAATLAALKPSFTFNDGSGNADVGDINSSGWMAPIQNSYISRGVYSGHRGVDYAANYGTPIVAPADCYVVFASNAYPNYGFLGSTVGVPQGGGNSVRVIFSINGETFAMNFHHMTNNVPAVSYNGTGQVVSQGTVLGYVGSSGNSTGPHAHIELFKLNQTVQQAVSTWYSTGDWQSSAGWGMDTPSYGSYGTRVDPRSYLG